jgi:eukaryotic-like serine/threonine-protein kinase
VTAPDLRDQLQAALGTGYVIERELGGGGMSRVFIATETALNRKVVIKVLSPELTAALSVERFRREILVAAQLQHPHIVPVLAAGEAAGLPYFTMPYVEGESLRVRLARAGELPVNEVVRILRDVASALADAHEHGVVHRDIKPENVLLTKHHALVADFGVAKALSASSTTAHGTAGDGSLTSLGVALGTPAYMAPEQAAADPSADLRADVYSLGAMAYEMLTGAPPFAGRTPRAMLAAHATEEIPPVVERRRATPTALASLVMRCLEKHPADRPQSAEEILATLDTIIATPSGESPPTTASSPASRATTAPRGLSRRPRWRRIPPVAAALSLGFVVGAGFLFAWRSRSRSALESTAGGPVRLAVLPFANLGDSADAYFADGVTDAVRDKLAGVPGLQVIASTSSAQYRGTNKLPQQIGQELGVRYFLVGKVRRDKGTDAGSRVQIRPELIEAVSAADKWGEPFDVPLADVFQVQGDIASKVSQALGVGLSAGEHDSLAARPTRNLAAYNAYLRGSELLHKAVGDPEAYRSAIVALGQAARLDSAFAQAWSALAVAEARLYAHGANFDQPDSALGAAVKSHAEHVAALAPNLAAAHWALASYYGIVLRDQSRAAAEYTLALRASPNDVDIMTGLAQSQLLLGHAADAVTLLGRAEALDPRSLSTIAALSEAYGSAGRFDAATDAANRGLRIDPTREGLLSELSLARMAAGDASGARAAVDRALALDPTSLQWVNVKSLTYLIQGDLRGARAVVANPPPGIDPNAVLAYTSTVLDLYWVLDDAQRQRLFDMPAATYLTAISGAAPGAGTAPRDRALALAHTAWLGRNPARARAYADSALPAASAVCRANPDDAGSLSLLADVEAYLGRRRDALRDAHRGIVLAQTRPATTLDVPYGQVQLARIFVIFNEPDSAAAALEAVPAEAPQFYSPAFLRIDPTWGPLHGNPRFERLIARDSLHTP